jgi:hypothetical protein
VADVAALLAERASAQLEVSATRAAQNIDASLNLAMS